MRRIELVMNSAALDTFKESVAELGVQEVDLSAIRRWSAHKAQRRSLYRGQTFTEDFLPLTRAEFAVFEEDKERVVRAIIATIHPESISIFKIDEVITFDRRDSSGQETRATTNAIPTESYQTDPAKTGSEPDQKVRGPVLLLH